MKNNEPVFPVAETDAFAGTLGLTKREYIAALAMSGMFSAQFKVDLDQDKRERLLVRSAVRLTDMLLNELEENTGEHDY